MQTSDYHTNTHSALVYTPTKSHRGGTSTPHRLSWRTHKKTHTRAHLKYINQHIQTQVHTRAITKEHLAKVIKPAFAVLGFCTSAASSGSPVLMQHTTHTRPHTPTHTPTRKHLHTRTQYNVKYKHIPGLERSPLA